MHVIIQEFVEARRAAALNNAPSCAWSLSPPPELKGAPAHALAVNAGFVTFGNSVSSNANVIFTFWSFSSVPFFLSDLTRAR